MRHAVVDTAGERMTDTREKGEQRARGEGLPTGPAEVVERAPYVAPQLEPLGAWRALTLQQSVGIAP